MSRHKLTCCGPRLGMFLVAVFVCAVVSGGEPKPSGSPNVPDVQRQSVDLFPAIDQGQVEAKVIARNERQARLELVNKTDKPLRIVLPEAFALVPALGQVGMMGPDFTSSSSRNRRDNKTTQALGTSSPTNMPMGPGIGQGMPMAGRGQAMGQRFFDVEPEKVGQIKLRTVCLQYGKPAPSAHVPYKIAPLDSVTTKAGVQELCTLLGHRDVDQGTIQAAAWHLANDMSWERLGRSHSAGLLPPRDGMFSPRQLSDAKKVAEEAVRVAEKRRQTKPSSPGSLTQN